MVEAEVCTDNIRSSNSEPGCNFVMQQELKQIPPILWDDVPDMALLTLSPQIF